MSEFVFVSHIVLLQVVTPGELTDDEEYEEIVEDMKEECGKFGKRMLSLDVIS